MDDQLRNSGLAHPLYNLELAPSVFRLFESPKKHFERKYLRRNDEVRVEVSRRNQTQNPDLFSAGTEKIPYHMGKLFVSFPSRIKQRLFKM
jgi:hypothetical protein